MLVLFLGLEVEKYLTSRKWPALTSENDKRRYALQLGNLDGL